MNQYSPPPSPPPVSGFYPSTYQPESEQERDKRTLNVLSILHYVYGGLCLVGVVVIVIQYLIFSTITKVTDMGVEFVYEFGKQMEIQHAVSQDSSVNAEEADLAEGGIGVVGEERFEVQPEPSVNKDSKEELLFLMQEKIAQGAQGFFSAFVYLYVTFAILLSVAGVMNIISAFFLARQRRMVFSQITAGINCIQIPLGLILGIFTFITLSKGSVNHLYRNH